MKGLEESLRAALVLYGRKELHSLNLSVLSFAESPGLVAQTLSGWLD